jgi:hypothetical protein
MSWPVGRLGHPTVIACRRAARARPSAWLALREEVRGRLRKQRQQGDGSNLGFITNPSCAALAAVRCCWWCVRRCCWAPPNVPHHRWQVLPRLLLWFARCSGAQLQPGRVAAGAWWLPQPPPSHRCCWVLLLLSLACHRSHLCAVALLLLLAVQGGRRCRRRRGRRRRFHSRRRRRRRDRPRRRPTRRGFCGGGCRACCCCCRRRCCRRRCCRRRRCRRRRCRRRRCRWCCSLLCGSVPTTVVMHSPLPQPHHHQASSVVLPTSPTAGRGTAWLCSNRRQLPSLPAKPQAVEPAASWDARECRGPAASGGPQRRRAASRSVPVGRIISTTQTNNQHHICQSRRRLPARDNSSGRRTTNKETWKPPSVPGRCSARTLTVWVSRYPSSKPPHIPPPAITAARRGKSAGERSDLLSFAAFATAAAQHA